MIRYAQECDLPEILQIYNDAILHTTAVYEDTVQTLPDRLAWFREKQAQAFPVLVYESGNNILGFATFSRFGTLSGFKYTVKDSVYVDKRHRCKYIGTKLLVALIEIAQSGGYATMVAEIDDSNESSKIMHEKVGFKNAGTICKAGYKFGTWLDLAVYQYELKRV